MKKVILIAFALGFSQLLVAQNRKTITVKNPSSFDRTELVSIPFKFFKTHYALKDTVFTLIDKASGKALPYQFEKLGTKSPQNVLVEVSLKAKKSLSIAIQGNPAPIAQQKTFARYVPERKDDFAWENDIVAFRAYGKALEGTSEDAQGFDFWAKRTNDLIINEWYKTGDYHADHGKGLDYFHVGQSLGLGHIAPYLNNTISYHKHYRGYEILDNGPLRTTFKLKFDPQEIQGNLLSIEQTITLDAGSQLNKISYSLKNKQQVTTPIVVGLVKRNEAEPLFENNAKTGIFAYWEPAEKDNITGTAVILNSTYNVINTKTQFLLETKITNVKPLVYYAGAAFNKAGKITSFEEWKRYLAQFKTSLKEPLILKYTK